MILIRSSENKKPKNKKKIRENIYVIKKKSINEHIMETLINGNSGMSDFLNAFYRQQHHLTELAKYQPNGYYDEKNKLKVNFIAVSVLYYS